MVVVGGETLDEGIGRLGMDELVELVMWHTDKDEAVVDESVLNVLLGVAIEDAEGFEMIARYVDLVGEVGKSGERIVDGLGSTLCSSDDEPKAPLCPLDISSFMGIKSSGLDILHRLPIRARFESGGRNGGKSEC